jgi:hypothetical protein
MYHGETCGVRTWVVDCAFENLLGMEIPSKNALILCKEKSILYSILRIQNTPTCCSNTPPKVGYLRCDSGGIYVTGTYPQSKNS